MFIYFVDVISFYYVTVIILRISLFDNINVTSKVFTKFFVCIFILLYILELFGLDLDTDWTDVRIWILSKLDNCSADTKFADTHRIWFECQLRIF